jgi:hypothetical protein
LTPGVTKPEAHCLDGNVAWKTSAARCGRTSASAFFKGVFEIAGRQKRQRGDSYGRTVAGGSQWTA